jgi:hypothetical protein
MKKWLSLFLVFSLPLWAGRGDGFSEAEMNLEQAYITGCGAHESATTSVTASMIGWGIGLAAGIAIITGVLHQSTSQSH